MGGRNPKPHKFTGLLDPAPAPPKIHQLHCKIPAPLIAKAKVIANAVSGGNLSTLVETLLDLATKDNALRVRVADAVDKRRK